MHYLLMLIIFLLGLITGGCLMLICMKKDGTLVINTYDPDKDVYSFEFKTPLNEIAAKRMIHFDVEVLKGSKPISQEMRPL